MSKMNRILVMAVAAGSLAVVGCGGPMEDTQQAGAANAAVEQSQQQLSKDGLPPDKPDQEPGSDNEPLAWGSNCYLVVYPPYLMPNPPSFTTRGNAFVSCSSSVSRIEIVVGLQDENETTRTRRFTCYNTSTCIGAYTALSPWGWWKTVAYGSASGWSSYRESAWTPISRD